MQLDVDVSPTAKIMTNRLGFTNETCDLDPDPLGQHWGHQRQCPDQIS